MPATALKKGDRVQYWPESSENAIEATVNRKLKTGIKIRLKQSGEFQTVSEDDLNPVPHDFFEGDRVSTPDGMGRIILAANNHCRVNLDNFLEPRPIKIADLTKIEGFKTGDRVWLIEEKVWGEIKLVDDDPIIPYLVFYESSDGTKGGGYRAAHEITAIAPDPAPVAFKEGEEDAIAESSPFVWKADLTLGNDDGPCRDHAILKAEITALEAIRADYQAAADKTTSKARCKDLESGIADKNRQIDWCMAQIEKIAITEAFGFVDREEMDFADEPEAEEAELTLLRLKDFEIAQPEPEPQVTYICLSEIRLDGGTQQRTEINLKHVQILEDELDEVEDLDPIDLYFDGENYWMADGFHRYLANKKKGREVILSTIHHGTQREAILASTAANAKHLALPRTRADRRKAIETLLRDKEWGLWSDREIARQTATTHPTVSAIRKQLTELVNLPLSQDRNYRRQCEAEPKTMRTNAKPSTKFEDGDYGSTQAIEERKKAKMRGEDAWSPSDFGETPRQIEPDGQGAVFFDSSVEPPEPDDFPTVEKYEQAHSEWQKKQPSPPAPEPIAVNYDEIYIGIKSNLDIYTSDHRFDLFKAIVWAEVRSLDRRPATPEYHFRAVTQDFLRRAIAEIVAETEGAIA